MVMIQMAATMRKTTDRCRVETSWSFLVFHLFRIHQLHYLTFTMAADLIQTARTQAATLSADSPCSDGLLVLHPLAAYMTSLPTPAMVLVTDYALCFDTGASRKAYGRSNATKADKTTTFSTMSVAIRAKGHLDIPRVFLCGSQHRKIGVKDATADHWHYVMVMKLAGAWHIFTTGGVEDHGTGKARVVSLQGMSVVAHLLRQTHRKPQATAWVKKREVEESSCIADAVEAAMEVFEAVAVHGKQGEEILSYPGLVAGRKGVVLTL